MSVGKFSKESGSSLVIRIVDRFDIINSQPD